MAATVESSNDTKSLPGIADDVTSLGNDLKGFATDLIKAAADIKKKPDECKKAAETIRGILSGIAKATSDMDALGKKLAKAVVK